MQRPFGASPGGAAAAPAPEPVDQSEGLPPVEQTGGTDNVLHRFPVVTAYIIGIAVLAFLLLLASVIAMMTRSSTRPGVTQTQQPNADITAHEAETHASGMPLKQPYGQPTAPFAKAPFRGRLIPAEPVQVELYPGAERIEGAPELFQTRDSASKIVEFYRAKFPNAEVRQEGGRSVIALRDASGEVLIELAQFENHTQMWVHRP